MISLDLTFESASLTLKSSGFFVEAQGPARQPPLQESASINIFLLTFAGSSPFRVFSRFSIELTLINWTSSDMPPFLIVSFMPPSIGYSAPS